MDNYKKNQAIRLGFVQLGWNDEYSEKFLKDYVGVKKINALTDEQANKIIKKLNYLIVSKSIKERTTILGWNDKDLKNFLKENFGCEEINELTYQQIYKAIKELSHLIILKTIKHRTTILGWNDKDFKHFLKENFNFKCEEINELTYEQALEAAKKLLNLETLKEIKHVTRQLGWSNKNLKDFLKENFGCEEINELTYEQTFEAAEKLLNLETLKVIKHVTRQLGWSNKNLKDFLKENFGCKEINELTFEQELEILKLSSCLQKAHKYFVCIRSVKNE